MNPDRALVYRGFEDGLIPKDQEAIGMAEAPK